MTQTGRASILSVALGLVFLACGSPKPSPAAPKTILLDDFESGTLEGWKALRGGSGGWFIYTDGQKAPDPTETDPKFPFDLPDPPQGKFAAVTDMRGPGMRILYRDVKLGGRFKIHLTLFHAGSGRFSSPDTLEHDIPNSNEQFRVDLVDLAAPIDSVAPKDVLLNVFRTSPSDPVRREPTAVSADLSPLAGQTVRLRLASADNQGPLRVGVDDIRFEPIDPDADARIELPATQEATSALHVVLHRMSEADALAALSARADELAARDEFSGAVLVARDGKVLLQQAWGLADRAAGTPNTPGTKFRIGSMNKMFTAVAVLQLVEAGKLALDDPVGRYLPDYPNRDVASKVTIRHLLTHTGGTGDIFGPDYEKNRRTLRELGDYVKLYGARGLAFEPGTRYEYSNYGFLLLGALLEKVTGQSYYELVGRNVYEPAGMTSTGSEPENVPVPGRSVGYTRPGDTWVPNTDRLPWRGTSAGGGYSTAGDLWRFAEALESGTLLAKQGLAEATRPQQERYGYGFSVQGEGPLRSYGHSGGFPGMNGELQVFPQLGYVVVVLSNLDPPAASRLVQYFAQLMPAGRAVP